MQVSHSRHLIVIPLALTTVRVLLAILMILLALQKAEGFSFVICLSLALVSDIFDGVVARHYGVASTFLRRYDSTADTIFYLSAVCAVWILYPEALRSNLFGLLCLLGLELTRYAVDFYKFGRETSYHMWSAKFWNLIMFAAFVALLGFGFAGWLLAAAIWVGIASDLEGLFATLLMPKWGCDVPTVWHAYRIRRLDDTPAPNSSFNPTPQ
jgi:CDP-diacylglycerol---glycerol-3-phosphate 3-phosphatidyltransferase